MAEEVLSNGAASVMAISKKNIDWKLIASAIGYVSNNPLEVTQSILRVMHGARLNNEEIEIIELRKGSGIPANEEWVDAIMPEELREHADEIVAFVLFCDEELDHVNLMFKRVCHRKYRSAKGG